MSNLIRNLREIMISTLLLILISVSVYASVVSAHNKCEKNTLNERDYRYCMNI